MTATLDTGAPPTDLADGVRLLMAEQGGALSIEAVTACLARCYDELRRDGVQAGLDHAAQAMARTRLRSIRSDPG